MNAKYIGFDSKKTVACVVQQDYPRHFVSTGWKLNFCPPTEASYIRPASPIVKTATPSAYLALAEAPDLRATADACAAKARLPDLKRSTAALFSKKISSVYFWPPRAGLHDDICATSYPDTRSCQCPAWYASGRWCASHKPERFSCLRTVKRVCASADAEIGLPRNGV
jgi:hypothetical protein